MKIYTKKNIYIIYGLHRNLTNSPKNGPFQLSGFECHSVCLKCNAIRQENDTIFFPFLVKSKLEQQKSMVSYS